VIAAAFLTVMAFSTIPTPLYAFYAVRDGFAAPTVTVIFAAYAVGVMASLYLAGHISDWLGRRRIILIAIAVELLADLVFLLSADVPALIVARFISGVGVGMLTATATAHLSELRIAAKPGADSAKSSTVSSFVNVGGLAIGPLIAGFLAQYVASPLVVPYVVFAVLLVIAVVAVTFVPETVERAEERRAYRPQRVSLPKDARPLFFAAGAGVVAAFAIFGLFTSLAPSFVSGTLHETSHVVAGVVPFSVFFSAAVAQVVFARLSARRQLQLSVVLMVVGLVSMATGVLVVSLPLFIVAGIVAGAGVGVLFRSAVGVAASIAPPESRGEVLAAIFLIAYTGLAVPVLLVGLALALGFAPTSVLLVFVAVVLVLAVVAGARMIASRK
jgi:MFS family permease